MTDATLSTIPIAAADELESPTRRALRRLFRRKGAVVGLVVIASFILLALFAPVIACHHWISVTASAGEAVMPTAIATAAAAPKCRRAIK